MNFRTDEYRIDYPNLCVLLFMVAECLYEICCRNFSYEMKKVIIAR